MKKLTLAVILLLLALSVQTAGAEKAREHDLLFRVFLSKLVERHSHLENIILLDVKIRTGTDMEDEAEYYVLLFSSKEKENIFMTVLRGENIPYFITDLSYTW